MNHFGLMKTHRTFTSISRSWVLNFMPNWFFQSIPMIFFLSREIPFARQDKSLFYICFTIFYINFTFFCTIYPYFSIDKKPAGVVWIRVSDIVADHASWRVWDTIFQTSILFTKNIIIFSFIFSLKFFIIHRPYIIPFRFFNEWKFLFLFIRKSDKQQLFLKNIFNEL